MFRRRDKGDLSGHKLDGLKRRLRAALERGTQQQCSRTANTGIHLTINKIAAGLRNTR
jgi:phosphoenolpyruvate carboxylase